MTHEFEISRPLLLGAAHEMLNCFTLAAAEQPDCPLVYVNPAFCKLTYYTPEECLGKNARFLRGPLSRPEAVFRIGQSVKRREAVFQDIINYKKDGTPFWNRMLLFPMTLLGEGMHYIGLQNDVTKQKEKLGFSFDDESYALVSALELQDRIVNPLTALLLNKSMLHGETDEWLQAELARRMEASLERLLASIMHL